MTLLIKVIKHVQMILYKIMQMGIFKVVTDKYIILSIKNIKAIFYFFQNNENVSIFIIIKFTKYILQSMLN